MREPMEVDKRSQLADAYVAKLGLPPAIAAELARKTPDRELELLLAVSDNGFAFRAKLDELTAAIRAANTQTGENTPARQNPAEEAHESGPEEMPASEEASDADDSEDLTSALRDT